MTATPAPIALVALAGLATGCGLVGEADAPLPVGSPLRPADGSPDGVRFEVYWATLPAAAEADAQAALWRFVQEERLDPGTRTRLRRNGFRAGVAGGVPPEAIVRLLDPRGAEDTEEENEEGGVSRLSAPTGVKRQEMTVRPIEDATINASDVIDEATVLLADERGPWGATFSRVQALYKIGVEAQPGGGTLVSLAPELHHGDPKARWEADDSGLMLRPKPLRDQETFPHLRIEAPLVVGEMLIVTSLPHSDSRLADLFHRADGDAPGARKAIVVRMVQGPLPAPLTRTGPVADRPDF